jgi:hypothetical protein
VRRRCRCGPRPSAARASRRLCWSPWRPSPRRLSSDIEWEFHGLYDYVRTIENLIRDLLKKEEEQLERILPLDDPEEADNRWDDRTPASAMLEYQRRWPTCCATRRTRVPWILILRGARHHASPGTSPLRLLPGRHEASRGCPPFTTGAARSPGGDGLTCRPQRLPSTGWG